MKVTKFKDIDSGHLWEGEGVMDVIDQTELETQVVDCHRVQGPRGSLVLLRPKFAIIFEDKTSLSIPNLV